MKLDMRFFQEAVWVAGGSVKKEDTFCSHAFQGSCQPVDRHGIRNLRFLLRITESPLVLSAVTYFMSRLATVLAYKIRFHKLSVISLLILFVPYVASLKAVSTITQGNWSACALQSDGGILAAGNSFISNINRCALARYTANGGTDTTFNTNGIVQTTVGQNSAALAVAVQSNGQIVLVGNTLLNGAVQALLIRYNADGTLDTNFGTNGIVTTSLGTGMSGNAVTFDAQGNILVAGSVTIDLIPQFFVARYSSTDGSLDTTFSSTSSVPGIATVPIGYRSKANAITLQPADGSIVLAGWASFGSGDEFALARFTSDGYLDTTFNSDDIKPGVITTQIGNLCQAYGVAIKSDGTILIAGNSDNALCILSFTSEGVANSSFGTNGVVLTTGIGQQTQCAYGIAIDASDNIIVAGSADNQLLIARYTDAGILDTTFNTNGSNTFSYGNVNVGMALQLTSTGNILVAGYADLDCLLVEFTTAGTLYSLFGTNGVVTEPQIVAASTTQIYEQQTVGTNGGTFTAGSWQTRNLTTINDGLGITLANNQFTLPAGSYTIQIAAPGYQVGAHQARLQNITDNETSLWGTSGFSRAASGSQTNSMIVGKVSVNQPTSFEVQHMCTATQSGDGFGIATGLGDFEIYTTVCIDPITSS